MRTALLLLAVLSLAAPAGATDYYVTKSGLDSNNCTQAQTLGTAKLTIAAGIACLSGGGDQLLVGSGTYVENITSGVPSGTSWSNKVRIAAIVPGAATLKPSGGPYAVIFLNNESYVEWDGINIDGENLSGSNVGDNFRVEAWAGGSPHHIRVKNATMWGTLQNSGNINSQPQMVNFIMSVSGRQGFNEMVNCTLLRGGGNQDFSHSVYASSNGNLFDGNDISASTGIGIQIYNGYSLDAADNIIRNNVIHDSKVTSGFRTRGILVSGSNNQVYNNVIHTLGNTDSIGIDVFSGSPLVYNNTVYNAKVGLYIEGQSGAVIRNNLLYGNTTSNYNANGFSPTEDHNSRSGTDPLFISAPTNLRLASNSPAKDAGTNTGIATDILGTARPMGAAYDIGAYEYILAAVDSPATGTIVVTDTFTDTAGDALISQHTGEIGGTWTVQPGATTGLVISSANRLRLNIPDVDTFAYASGVPVSSQYDVRTGIHTFTTITDHTYLLWARMSTSDRSGYMAIYNRVPAALELWAVVTGSYTLLGSCTKTFADNSDDTIALEVRTGTERLWYGTTLCVDATDTSITATGRGGVGIYAPTSADTNSTGSHFDNFIVQDVDTLIPSTTCTACRYRFVR